MSRMSFGRLGRGGAGAGGGDGPFRILLMGDFSGRQQRGLLEPDLAARTPQQVDVDNYEHVLSAMGSEVRVPLAAAPGGAGGEVAIRITELEDFHPDRLLKRLEVFQALRALRSRLQDAGTFAAAAEEVRSWAGKRPAAAEPAAPPAAAAPATPPPGEPGLLEGLLGKRPAHVQGAAGGAAKANVEALIRDVVAPHVVPQADRDQPALVAKVEAAMSAQLRALLHHPSFRAVERTWRAVHFLVTSLETGEDLQLYAVDVTRQELAADLAAGDLLRSGLHKLLVEHAGATEGGQSWGAVATGFTFDKTVPEAALLARVAVVAAAARAPLLAAAADRVVGCQSLARTPDPDDWTVEPGAAAAAAWAELRKMPQASYVALGLPRFLLRLPYGADTEAVEPLAFEELGAAADHESYLWGNPAFVLAQALGAGFTEHGWAMAPQLYRDVQNLPMHVVVADGRRRVKPCAEVYLSDRAGERIVQQGVTPLLSIQGRDAVRLRGIASLADPACAINGRWNV